MTQKLRDERLVFTKRDAWKPSHSKIHRACYSETGPRYCRMVRPWIVFKRVERR